MVISWLIILGVYLSSCFVRILSERGGSVSTYIFVMVWITWCYMISSNRWEHQLKYEQQWLCMTTFRIVCVFFFISFSSLSLHLWFGLGLMVFCMVAVESMGCQCQYDVCWPTWYWISRRLFWLNGPVMIELDGERDYFACFLWFGNCQQCICIMHGVGCVVLLTTVGLNYLSNFLVHFI